VTQPLRIALGEYDTGWRQPEESLDRAALLIREAAERGAELVILPEMCTTGFMMEPSTDAEPVDGPSVRRLGELARESGVHLIAGVATRAMENGVERFYNSAVFITPDGRLAGEYRKQRLFAYAREHESYAAGDRPLVVTAGSARLGIFICFDLRFPELFRPVAPFVDAIVVVANWPVERESHWETLLRARAIESQAYVAGVNRIGRGGRLEYGGKSVLHDAWGEIVAKSGGTSPAVAAIDPAEVAKARERFPLVADRRSETFPAGE
jgi:predicted amidohydrolase